MMGRSLTLVALLALLLIAGTAFAQQTINYASASGVVTDPAGASVAGASISARQIETNQTSTATTDPEGRFRFPYLKPGEYEITVHQSAFADIVRLVTLTIGTTAELNFSLTLASVETTVDVSDQKEVLETGRTEIAGTVAQTEVTDLPVNGRNFLDIVRN
jgi:hypothetical protein